MHWCILSFRGPIAEFKSLTSSNLVLLPDKCTLLWNVGKFEAIESILIPCLFLCPEEQIHWISKSGQSIREHSNYPHLFFFANVILCSEKLFRSPSNITIWYLIESLSWANVKNFFNYLLFSGHKFSSKGGDKIMEANVTFSNDFVPPIRVDPLLVGANSYITVSLKVLGQWEPVCTVFYCMQK